MSALKLNFKHLRTYVVILGITAISVNFISCNSTETDGVPITNNAKDQKNSKTVKNLISNFEEGVPIDSTSYVIYPIALSSLKEESEMKIYSSENRQHNYWNIAFYNIETGNSRLLDSGRVLMIRSYDRVGNYLLYKVTTDDYDLNGKLDYGDPAYLFVSDLSGAGFRQISPNNTHVASWTITKKPVRILIQAVADSNNDKKFDDKDRSIGFVFDPIKDQTARETFTSDFNKKVSDEFSKLYSGQ